MLFGRYQRFISLNNCQLTDNVAGDKLTVAGFFDLNAAEDLADDDLKVFVGDILALGSKNLKDFIHDIALGRLDSLQTNQILEINRTISQPLSSNDLVA